MAKLKSNVDSVDIDLEGAVEWDDQGANARLGVIKMRCVKGIFA
tara:strand:+ start:389 stop:520 length:132 start_codon:yes stop_codon:yes gene_type:complete